MKTVPIWGLDESREYYGTKDDPGPIYDIFDKSAKFWEDTGGDQVDAGRQDGDRPVVHRAGRRLIRPA